MTKKFTVGKVLDDIRYFATIPNPYVFKTGGKVYKSKTPEGVIQQLKMAGLVK